MKRLIPLLALLAAGACVPVGGYMSAEVVYAEPPVAVYEVPVDRVIVVSREVLVSRGYVVYRVETRGPNRVIWARRGGDEVVRLFVTPQGRQVAVQRVRDGLVWSEHLYFDQLEMLSALGLTPQPANA